MKELTEFVFQGYPIYLTFRKDCGIDEDIQYLHEFCQTHASCDREAMKEEMMTHKAELLVLYYEAVIEIKSLYQGDYKKAGANIAKSLHILIKMTRNGKISHLLQ